MKTSEMFKIIFNLVVIYLVGGMIMAFLYAQTSPIKFKKEKEEKEAALKLMMPEADNVEKIGDWEPHGKHAEYYAARKCEQVKVETLTDEKTGKLKEEKKCIGPTDIGYIVENYGKGYSSYIHVLTAVDRKFIVQKISVLGHGETPGLGDEIEKDYFLNMFAGKTVDTLEVIKGETKDKIQSLTGATISTRAAAEDAVRNGVKMLTERLSGEVSK